MNNVSKRIVLLFVMMTMLPMMIKASDMSKDIMVVWTKDGEKTAYALKERPVLKFTDTEILLFSGGIEISFPLELFARYTYESSDLTGVYDISTEEIYGYFDGDYLLFPSLRAKSTVSIYSLSGRLIIQKRVKADGEYSFPLASLPSGIYIIKVNGLTYKISKQ